MTNKYVVDVSDTVNGFKFRLREKETGRHTAWALYAQVVKLDDVVAATEYFVPADIALIPIAPSVFCDHWSVGEEK